METNCGVSDKKEKSATEQLKNAPAQGVVVESTGVQSALDQLRTLTAEGLGTGLLPDRLGSPIDLDQLEMLEAELRNQGILPLESEGITTLTQHAVHTASILRWRARRAGAWADNLQFTVRLPEYLLSRADELLSTIRSAHAADPGEAELLVYRARTWGKANTPGQRLYAELDYLERFASYLIGEYDKSANRYQQGLNLILRVVSRQKLRALSQPKRRREDREAFSVSLPVELGQFLSVLRKQRDEAAAAR
ncbi:MAG: hypothetical protein U0136_03205 [Bdellovibrionota bacterium]